MNRQFSKDEEQVAKKHTTLDEYQNDCKLDISRRSLPVHDYYSTIHNNPGIDSASGWIQNIWLLVWQCCPEEP